MLAPNISPSRQIRPFAEAADTGAKRILPQLSCRRFGQDADVVMGAGVDAVEAKGAVHIACLPWLEQVQFAAGNAVSAADAVLGLALRTCVWVEDLYFQWRHQRLHEIKLADRTDILTKRGAAKETVDDKGCAEVADRNPRSPPGTVPEGKRLISPKKHGK